jgi:hypothetical protein
LLNSRSVVGAYDAFMVDVAAREPEAVGVEAIAKAAGLAIGRGTSDGTISCVNTLKGIWLIDEGATLSMAIRLIKDAWGFRKAALEGKAIEGLALFLSRFRHDIDRDVLVGKLAKYPQQGAGLLGSAKPLLANRSEKASMARCVAELVVMEYNKGRGSRTKLDPARIERREGAGR